MPEPPVALVAADDLVSVVRVHADRVHDLVRRTGCRPAEATEIVEGSALDLIEQIVSEPESVGDMVGWWFGHAYDLARRVVARHPDRGEVFDQGETSRSLLAGTSGEAQVRAALGRLSARHRLAVLLRDAYDLPPASVAVALGVGEAAAVALVAEGRLRFLMEYDQRPKPVATDHGGRSVDTSDLARLADGTLPAQRAVPLRRHLYGCAGCEEMVEAFTKARRVVAGLPVLAMTDEDRDELLTRITARAQATLPTLEEVLLAAETVDDPPPVLSPAVAIAVILAALLLGVLVGYLTRGTGPRAPSLTAGSGPTATTTAAPTASPTHRSSPRPSHSATVTPSVTPTSPRPSAAATTPAAARTAAVAIAPGSGPNGQTLTVTGHGWQPNITVTIVYLNPVGAQTGATATALPDATGSFVTKIVAEDPANLPGPHRVHATNGTQSADATYEAGF